LATDNGGTVSWSREELESAFSYFLERTQHAVDSGDWATYAEFFTEDATYIEHTYGRFAGREEIRKWIVETMTTFPGTAMIAFPPVWYSVDEEKGWIIGEFATVMRDPGDGSTHEATNLTILRYAGDNLWHNEEDWYNPAHFFTLLTRWGEVAATHGTLSDDEQRWYAEVRS
jgi:ketosteroid isomerase-like protein